ncbi:hypothetical protein SMACR_04998 [Sordaria macrospora]|uniref:WGS project CABT00000000 data, contig 2.8 n=2 Tax=Sordaria macrospora TaxID=5147 RepID=F7VUP3_SORMK|nr:uncharacterized protein SMAC_04998 [Sordaria macrospora k-hell]KAA8636203.1 hypothetical protein SMACR_04998 [Sordaria macrospora]WPJ57461.1 hypothetical protein SMAC4_04998 [Sordaria macrospora]CCC09239.1 unnamed protein product [Sordaria macrospora k-hell]
MALPALDIPTWSPGFLAGKQKIPRSILRVHRDQQELLDRQDAWNPDGFANVPAELLQEVKAQYIRSIAPPPSPLQRTPSPAPQHTESVREDEEQDEPSTPKPTGTGSEEGTPIPWSPSPEHHIRPTTPVNDGEAKDRTPELEPSPEHDSTPKQATIATPDLPTRALPERLWSQKRPAEHRPSSPPVFKVKARVPFLPEFPPSSSVASEGGLEFEVPKAVTDVLPPVNKAALPILPHRAELEQTPPSAQIIPASYLSRTTPSRPPPEKHRRIMPKSVTTVYSDYRSTAEPERSSATFPRAETEDTAMTRLSEHIADTQQPSGEQSADTSSHSVKTTEQGTQQLASSDEKIPPNGPPSQVPYTAYKVAYPDYEGTLGDFVRAVLCVRDLRKRSAIMEFLYDDFVRYYCNDYLQYIREAAADGHGHVPVRAAIEFYNDQVSRPRYQKGVLTKENINDVLDKYPKMVRSISETLESAATPSVLEENGDSSKPKVAPIIPSPSTTNRLPKACMVAKSTTKALVGTLRAELASDPIYPPSSIPQKRIRPVIQAIDRSVPRRLSNRPLELEPPIEDEPIPGSDAAAPIEIDSASSSLSPSPSPPPAVLPQPPSRSQGRGPTSSATKVTRPQEQVGKSSPPREASAGFKRPRLDTSPPPPPASSTKITTQQVSISPPPPRRASNVAVSSLTLPINHQRTQQENIRPSSQIVPGTPAPAPAPAPARSLPQTTAPSPSCPLITQIPTNTNLTNPNTNLPMLSQLSNADSIPDPFAPSSPTTRSKLLSSSATKTKTKIFSLPLPPGPSRPASTTITTGTTAAVHHHLVNQNPNPFLSTQTSNADSIPEPSLPPRLQRQRNSIYNSSLNSSSSSSSSSRLTSSNLSRLAHITSSRKFLQRKPAVGTPIPSSSASGSGMGSGSGSVGVGVTSSAVSGVVGSGGIVKSKGKDKGTDKGKGKAKVKDTGRDLRAQYFVEFVRKKKMQEMREAAERAEKEKAAAASSSHPVPEGSNGR